MATVDFWFEFGSTYTYLTVARIARTAARAGVEVRWRPFLLVPLLVQAGLPEGPFLPFPNKMAYMWRDLERRAAEHGLAYARPSRYPVEDTLGSARLAYLGAREGWVQAFTETAFLLHWTRDIAIGSPANVEQALRAANQEPEAALARARTDEVKTGLRAQTEEAGRLKIFGSPSFVAAGELFWGDDRLEQALAWARQGGRP